MPRLSRLIRAVSAVLCGSGTYLHAQSTPATPVSAASMSRQFDTRRQLETQAKSAEQQGRASEAWLLRSRLQRGDFQEGDRIVVMLDGALPTRDTLQVRSGQVLQFPSMGELALTGVLRSELTDTVRHHLARYLNSPRVRATPLLPVAVLGSVAQPGFYYTPADVVLRDVLMRAGGLLAAADVNKIIIRRAGEVIWKAPDVRVALSDGLSLDGLHLRAGDEIFVPERRRIDASTIITFISSGAAVAMVLVNLMQ